MPALVAGIHVFGAARKAWMAGTSPAMTEAASVGWMERSEIRIGIDAAQSFPDFAAPHPDYLPCLSRQVFQSRWVTFAKIFRTIRYRRLSSAGRSYLTHGHRSACSMSSSGPRRLRHRVSMSLWPQKWLFDCNVISVALGQSRTSCRVPGHGLHGRKCIAVAADSAAKIKNTKPGPLAITATMTSPMP